MTRAASYLLSLHARRVNPPPHLSYPWQRAKDQRRGAAIVDPEAWDKAWREAMPADDCDFSTLNREG